MQASEPTRKRARDIRLDFFRGVCLFIIFVAHVYANAWAAFIPARFGFSDATEIFVFCSGMASAIAFGGIFERRGFVLGSARIVFRVWQVYWAHIAVFLVALVMMLATESWLGTTNQYLSGLMMEPLFDGRARSAVIGLMTLSYVPPFFDILPMYLVILAFIPGVMALARLGRGYVAAAVVGVWFVSGLGYLGLPREPWGPAQWFFNPFSWQLIFFTGFAFMRGWLPAPRPDRRAVLAAVAIVVICLPFEWEPLLHRFEILVQGREVLGPLIDKSHLGILRFIHFLALAYLSYVAVGEAGCRLKGPVVALISKVGQQSLAVFVAGLILSFAAGIFLNVAGRTYLTVPVANLVGMGLLIVVAYTVGWFKSAPWSVRRPVPANTGNQVAADPRVSESSGRSSGSQRLHAIPAE
ncbi:MAG TPA: OpgC domain-containing protein [Hyphomicrobiaceae bacterium]|nr:OpgC domain-containing protein [Hyphomicrobiaceae bacterium]